MLKTSFFFSRELFHLAWLVLGTSLPLSVQADDKTDLFEQKIRPAMVKYCYECHAGDPDAVQGGLRLDDPVAMARGGDSGPAIAAGKPDDSLLIAAIQYGDLKMPPRGKLAPRIIRDFETWISAGAVDPRDSQQKESARNEPTIDWPAARSQWAFQSPMIHAAPNTINSTWPTTPIDSFVLADLEGANLSPNSAADRATFIRRLSFDLRGLPPTPGEVNRYVSDNRPGSKRRLVDTFLASPEHAERWSRVWLDVARYAEDQAHKVGSNDSLTYPNAHHYRDWVINAIANDFPYDQFVRMQLAADLIVPDDKREHIALGFLGLGPKYYRRNSPEVLADEWEDRIDTVSRGLLGLTVACARCHDHKYDPIPTSDYYALAGVFASTEMFNRPVNETVEKQDNGQAKKPKDAYHIVRDGQPKDINLMIRGDVNKQGEVVPRRFLTVLSAEPVRFNNGSGRGDLAAAITARSNPLTARVLVNRVWEQLLGQPLVGTPSNFGALGEKPTHPELLDDLAVRFMDHGWSWKWLQREIVLSSTYAQSSHLSSAKRRIDPENRLLSRMTLRRLSIESYRDAILSVSGRLSSTVGGPSIKPDQPQEHRRTLYSQISRMNLNPMLARFDFPDPNAHSALRFETTTPLQKLFLLNSPFMAHQADALATRLTQHGGSNRSKIEWAYKLLFSREPNPTEISLAEKFVAQEDADIWTQYAQALLISNEMFMVD
ncbi:MAG: PSD1 and planctomycete cytochrome C domain-containing protein [Rubripirellula sp.]|nr:PSD1 and planctomycete cytochrome C domain-containing protein [Rubripirellula sp.]